MGCFHADGLVAVRAKPITDRERVDHVAHYLSSI
jgi:hypothetical protein